MLCRHADTTIPPVRGSLCIFRLNYKVLPWRADFRVVIPAILKRESMAVCRPHRPAWMPAEGLRA